MTIADLQEWRESADVVCQLAVLLQDLPLHVPLASRVGGTLSDAYRRPYMPAGAVDRALVLGEALLRAAACQVRTCGKGKGEGAVGKEGFLACT